MTDRDDEPGELAELLAEWLHTVSILARRQTRTGPDLISGVLTDQLGQLGAEVADLAGPGVFLSMDGQTVRTSATRPRLSLVQVIPVESPGRTPAVNPAVELASLIRAEIARVQAESRTVPAPFRILWGGER